MTYEILYEADFECLNGHRYRARVTPFSKPGEAVICPACYAAWLTNTIPHGRQVSEPEVMRTEVVPLGVKYTGGTS